MDWGFLTPLAEPWFVLPWYAVGVAGFFYVMYDIRHYNSPLKVAMKWAWPIIVLFFSVIGLALYFSTARAPGIGRYPDQDAKHKAHMAYEKGMFRRVNGAVVLCVAGEGLGIMTAMVVARTLGMSFWQEFWFEYLIGFLSGWFIFQFRSMLMMTESKSSALLMAFRAEFMSMLTVMAGMGAVMGYVTPLTVTEQPKPLTFAFWGFGMFGLLVGYVFTWPMNWLMVKVGWKHGMGGIRAARKHQVRLPASRRKLVGWMSVMGAAALVFPAWLVEVRDGTPVDDSDTVMARTHRALAPDTGFHSPGAGLSASLEVSLRALENGDRSRSVHALDAAHRAAVVANEAVSNDGFFRLLKNIEAARHELHMGRERGARDKLALATQRAINLEAKNEPAPEQLARFGNATVINAQGVKIGEVVKIDSSRIEVAIGGVRNFWGFLDFPAREHIEIAADEVLSGPARFVGRTMVSVPAVEPQ